MPNIDFSSKHNILLEDEDGTLRPMDEPYFRAIKIANGTWQILSDGDYSYLLEGEDEAFVIDSGYGAGNIREFCETVTDKPVRRIANTHDHFDHTANNCYFECAYMAAETKPLASIPFPSFDGIDFPRDYPIVIVDDGDIIPIKGRDLLVLKIPDHAVGSIVLLDRKERLLFTGDEIGMVHGKSLNGSVERWLGYMDKLLKYRDEYDAICAGFAVLDAKLIEQYRDNAKHILAGNEGVPTELAPFPNFMRTSEDGRVIWKRFLPHPGDGPKNWGEGHEYKRVMDYADCKIIYDIRKVHED
jgi:glyoxylase-like metal-dependent hydrolase (beta-lactamase superfamily II)